MHFYNKKKKYAACTSICANAPRKSMNPSILRPAIRKE